MEHVQNKGTYFRFNWVSFCLFQRHMANSKEFLCLYDRCIRCTLC